MVVRHRNRDLPQSVPHLFDRWKDFVRPCLTLCDTDVFGHDHDASPLAFSMVRRLDLSSFPLALRGRESTKWICRGFLYDATFAVLKASNSSTIGTWAPSTSFTIGFMY